jgi:hypothetical protein
MANQGPELASTELALRSSSFGSTVVKGVLTVPCPSL